MDKSWQHRVACYKNLKRLIGKNNYHVDETNTILFLSKTHEKNGVIYLAELLKNNSEDDKYTLCEFDDSRPYGILLKLNCSNGEFDRAKMDKFIDYFLNNSEDELLKNINVNNNNNNNKKLNI